MTSLTRTIGDLGLYLLGSAKKERHKKRIKDVAMGYLLRLRTCSYQTIPSLLRYSVKTSIGQRCFCSCKLLSSHCSESQAVHSRVPRSNLTLRIPPLLVMLLLLLLLLADAVDVLLRGGEMRAVPIGPVDWPDCTD